MAYLMLELLSAMDSIQTLMCTAGGSDVAKHGVWDRIGSGHDRKVRQHGLGNQRAWAIGFGKGNRPIVPKKRWRDGHHNGHMPYQWWWIIPDYDVSGHRQSPLRRRRYGRGNLKPARAMLVQRPEIDSVPCRRQGRTAECIGGSDQRHALQTSFLPICPASRPRGTGSGPELRHWLWHARIIPGIRVPREMGCNGERRHGHITALS